ncbi:MAG: hypothetical protein V3S51_08825, partial [Dehalococcoidia bacterium]
MNRRSMVRVALITLLAVLALATLLVQEFHVPVLGDKGNGNNALGMSLGLDLSGGIHLVYEADLSQIGDEDPSEAMRGAIDIIQNRVNAYGVSEPIIQKQGSDRISVQLPGI